MDQAKLVELRSQLVMRIREAITPDEPVTEELQEATLQALCSYAGSVFAAQRGSRKDEVAERTRQQTIEKKTVRQVPLIVRWLTHWCHSRTNNIQG